MSLVVPAIVGRRLAVLGLVTVLLVAAVVGAVSLGVVGTPTVDGVQNRFGPVNESTTTIYSDLQVSNPNPIGIDLGETSATYTVQMNGITMATGSKSGLHVPHGHSTLNFTTYMRNDRIQSWWVSHLRNGEHTDVSVDATVHPPFLGQSFTAPSVTRSVDTDVISAFNSTETRPIDVNKPFVSDPVAYVNRTSAAWGNVTEQRTPIRMQFDVYNPKSTPITITGVGYDVQMNDIAMGSGATKHSYVIPPHESRTVETTTVIRNDKLGQWWVSHLENGQVTHLRIDFYVNVDLSSFGVGTVRVPLKQLSYTHTISTDIFGTKNASTTDSARQTAGTDGSATTETTTNTPMRTQTATDTPTATRTSTTASTLPVTQTTTDGGLLAVERPHGDAAAARLR